MTDTDLQRLDRARERMGRARNAWAGAAQAVRRGDPDGRHRADKALIELNAARAELREITEAE